MGNNSGVVKDACLCYCTGLGMVKTKGILTVVLLMGIIGQ